MENINTRERRTWTQMGVNKLAELARRDNILHDGKFVGLKDFAERHAHEFSRTPKAIIVKAMRLFNALSM